MNGESKTRLFLVIYVVKKLCERVNFSTYGNIWNKISMLTWMIKIQLK